jgi:hypothetical protein
MASKLIEEFANELLDSSNGNGRTVMTARQAWAIAGEVIDQELGRPKIDELRDRHLLREQASDVIKELKGKGK